MALQLTLFDPPPAPRPEGFAYRPGLISPGEEQALAAAFEALPFKPYDFRGYQGARLTVSYGWRYDETGRRIEPAAPIPDLLLPLRAQVAAFAGLPAEAFEHALVVRYPPGAPIGWHRDRPAFGVVAGVSLLAPAPLRLRLERPGGGWERITQRLDPRSAYVLDGPARSLWEHSIPPLDELRYSVTFRTLARATREKYRGSSSP